MSRTIRNVKKWGRTRRPLYKQNDVELEIYI